MGLDFACEADGERGVVVQSAPDLLGIFADDGEVRIDLGETLVTQGVSTADVWCDVGIWRGEVGQDGFGESSVAAISVFERLGAVGVGLEESDCIGDDRVGEEVLEGLSQYGGTQIGLGMSR